MINTGLMRYSIRIERRTTAQDTTGEPVLTWTRVATRRCAIEASAGKEKWTASAERQATVPTIFRLRYLSGVLPAMRVIYSIDDVEKVFNIISAVDPDGRRVELVITAEELVEETL